MTTLIDSEERARVLEDAGAAGYRAIPIVDGIAYSATADGWRAAVRAASPVGLQQLDRIAKAALAEAIAAREEAEAAETEATSRAAAGIAEDARNAELQEQIRREATEYARQQNDVPTLLRKVIERLASIEERLEKR